MDSIIHFEVGPPPKKNISQGCVNIKKGFNFLNKLGYSQNDRQQSNLFFYY